MVMLKMRFNTYVHTYDTQCEIIEFESFRSRLTRMGETLLAWLTVARCSRRRRRHRNCQRATLSAGPPT